ncbi:MAG TPA: hypothetical protein VKW78_08060 [Terriglobales bacterium]|nr:hypothetical protein [Terriglobales bacterium]
MRCHWEKLGVLGPIYRLVSQGLDDRAIADRLNIPEEMVQGCIAWLLRFLPCQSREDLVLSISAKQTGRWILGAA